MVRRFLSLPLIVRLAVIAWLALLVAVTVRVAIAPPWKGTVVNIYILAAERWLAGENVYLWQPGVDLYRNPPGVTPLLTPLTLVPPKLAGILWRLAGAAAFLWGLHSLQRSTLKLTSSQTGAVFLLALPLALASLSNGQMNLLIAGVLMLGSASVARDRVRGGSLWLGVAAGLKIYPAAIGLLIATAYPRRLLPGFLLVITAFVIVPFLCQRTDYVLELHRSMAFSAQHDIRTYDDVNRAPQDAFLVLHACGLEPGKGVYHVVQFVAALGMAMLVRRAARNRRSPAELASLAFHLGCIWMTVLGPASEGPTYTLLAPSSAILLVTAYQERFEVGGHLRFWLALASYAILISPILRDAFPHGAGYRSLGPFPAGGFLLLVLVVWNALRSSSPASSIVITSQTLVRPLDRRRTSRQTVAASSEPRSGNSRYGD